jgi:hypothetical protein
VRGLQRRPDDANAALDEASALATMASLEHTAELIAVVRDALGAWSGRAGDVVAMRATLAAIPFAHPVVSVLTEALVDA